MNIRPQEWMVGAFIAGGLASILTMAIALDDMPPTSRTTTIAVESPLSGSAVECGGDVAKLYIMFREPDGELAGHRAEADAALARARSTELARRAALAATPATHEGDGS